MNLDSEFMRDEAIRLGYFAGLTVDGLDYPDGVFAGDGTYPPFVVFDAGRQQYLRGEYATREQAQAALVHIRLQEED